MIRVLEKEMERRNVRVHLHSEVKEVLTDGAAFSGLLFQNGKKRQGMPASLQPEGFPIRLPEARGMGTGLRKAQAIK